MTSAKLKSTIPIDEASESVEDREEKYKPTDGRQTCRECSRRIASPSASPPMKRPKKLVNRADQMGRGSSSGRPETGFYLHVIPFAFDQSFYEAPPSSEKVKSGIKPLAESFNDRIQYLMPLNVGTCMDANSATIFFSAKEHARESLDKLKVSTSKARSHVGRYRNFRAGKMNMLVQDDVFPVE